MGLQVCPECGVKNMTWSMDEEVSDLVLWHCNSCGFAAEEDEKKEAQCPACRKQALMWIITKSKVFQYCWECAHKQDVDEAEQSASGDAADRAPEP